MIQDIEGELRGSDDEPYAKAPPPMLQLADAPVDQDLQTGHTFAHAVLRGILAAGIDLGCKMTCAIDGDVHSVNSHHSGKQKARILPRSLSQGMYPLCPR
eukprot:7379145-Pyramimonas_sp.AAC.1